MEQITTLDTNDLETVLSDMGLSVAFSGLDISPSSVIYHFTLNNVLDLPKVKKIIPCLSVLIHKDIKIIKSEKASFGLSIPRDKRAFPTFRANHLALKNKPAGEILFGINEKGEPITRNIRDTKSILVGGSSGGGKSVCLSNILCSLMCYSKPEECGLILIDLKRCEFELFKNSHHLACPAQFDYDGAFNVLCGVKKEIENRYKSMQQNKIRKATTDKYPLLITVIDEYAELANKSNKNELDRIVSSIASTGRACNVFLIIATQHAISSIISNTIKSNLQSVIGLRTKNVAQSVCIINTRDCVDLLGYGDSYISFDGVADLQRIQGCYVDENDINEMLKEQNLNPPQRKPQTAQKQTFWGKIKAFFTNMRKNAYIPLKHRKYIEPYTDKELNYIDCCIDDEM